MELFDQRTASWFTNKLGSPTAVQQEAWPAIAAGEHTLVSAPTGTGKTLSAFLVFIDRLIAQSKNGTLRQELQLIYVSPLKSLAGDIRENLKRPLDGILNEYSDATTEVSLTAPILDIAIRTGDTPQNERRKMIKKPPHILITTPESLYLMLTSKTGQGILCTANAIIIDELHALIDSKRGAHMLLSIARLDKLHKKPLQRIGLSATIEPLDTAAKYLSPDPVTFVAPKMHKEISLIITSPLALTKAYSKDPVWQEIANTVYSHCIGSRSVIAFVEGRAYAEKLAYYVNQIGGEGFARTHHGSLSKEQRFEVENALRSGSLRLLCATSSMELGIDVGEIDQVFQVGCPRSISSTLQRLGRAGHNPNRTSVMYIFPRVPEEGLYSGLTAEVVRNGEIEHSHPPRQCFDVLAQHLVSMANEEGYEVDEVMELLQRAYPFYEVTKEDIKDVLCMLAGDYEHERNIPVRPRLLYDRIHDRVEGDAYSRMLAVSAGGTIPDRGMFAVKNESGVKLGEVEEEFVFESKKGDRFLLGTFAWKIQSIQKDSIIVSPTESYGARLPFWKGDMKGRSLKTGLAFGKILKNLSYAHETNTLFQKLQELGLDEAAAQSAGNFLKRQIEATGILPDDHTIIMEHFRDETGNYQLMVHSIFGKQVNTPLAILLQIEAKRQMSVNISYADDDDGFLLFPYGGNRLPEGLLQRIDTKNIKEVLEAVLPATPLFNMNFRYNAARALLTGVRKQGRQPLWIQRLRSAEMLDALIKYKNHPIIRETKRECLNDYWDLSGVEYVLSGIRSGSIKVNEIYLDTPSPMSMPLRHQTEATMMYDYAPTPPSVHSAVEQELEKTLLLTPSKEELTRVTERNRLPEDEKQLHSLLMIEGDFIAGELELPIEWLESLAHNGQAAYIEPGLWIAAEHTEKYLLALEQNDFDARLSIVLRLLRYRGAMSPELIAERYFFSEDEALKLLATLCEQGEAVENDGLYYHAKLYEKARHHTIINRRRQTITVPSERYAALLASRTRMNAPLSEQLDHALKNLSGQPYPPALWESVLLPARVGGYRPELLDNLLSQGNIIWQFQPDIGLSFHPYEEFDWEADLSETLEILDGSEKLIYEALLKRGASFIQRLTGILGGVSPYDTLLSLIEKGLVYADSFMPIRQWLNKEKLQKSTIRQRVTARSKVLSSGRFELSRPFTTPTTEQLLDSNFDRAVILSRETVQGIAWVAALETLRVWEYTGRVRRGYFIEGLSGIQFIRDKDYNGIMYELEKPREDIFWLSAVDPAQPWGKYLTHCKERAFLNVPGTIVALKAGVPIAVFERQGKQLRVFEEESLLKALELFVQDFNRKIILSTLNRILVKEYPKEAEEALRKAGFMKELQDYVLYR